MADVYPFSIGVMKGLIVRHLSDWFSKPIFDRNHILTIGYGYPNLVMGERYNGPGSPYWSLKTFAILMLSDEHPFWSAKAEPFPRLEQVKKLQYADMLMQVFPKHTTAYAPGKYSSFGHGQSQAKYGKFAYDTKFGFNVSKSSYELHESAPDSMLAFLINGYVYVRRICESFELMEDRIVSKWSPFEGIQVETTIIPNEEGHRRIHIIQSNRDCIAYDCGFAVAADPSQGIKTEAMSGRAKASCDFAQCEISGRYMAGNKEQLEGEIITADPNTNILFPKTVIPAVKYEICQGVTQVESIVKADWFKAVER
jgi:hypothetical protein